jgi:hypothetical protein
LLSKASSKFTFNRVKGRKPARIPLQDRKFPGSPIVSQTRHPLRDKLVPENEGKASDSIQNEDESQARQHAGTSERLSSDPADYRHARKALKKAVLEHYR